MGKDIKLKADKALLEGKKYFSYWTEFMGKDGKFPTSYCMNGTIECVV